jgi:hypothetical protein
LRKLLTVAVAASATLSLAGAAVAQAPEAVLKASATPSKAGTVTKPKNVTFAADLTVNKPATTVETIELNLPKGLKLSGKGLGKCNIQDLIAQGPTACPAKSKAGPVGEAHAVAGPTRAPVDFVVTPFVENASSLLFHLNSTLGLQTAIRGKITKSGTRLTITIPPELRHPGNIDSSLTGLKQSFKAKVGKHFLVSSTACKGGKWKFTGKLGFAKDRLDGTPAPADLVASASSKCKK